MIKFLDLHKINERYRKEIDERIKKVLDSGWYLLGKENDFAIILQNSAAQNMLLVLQTDLMH